MQPIPYHTATNKATWEAEEMAWAVDTLYEDPDSKLMTAAIVVVNN